MNSPADTALNLALLLGGALAVVALGVRALRTLTGLRRRLVTAAMLAVLAVASAASTAEIAARFVRDVPMVIQRQHYREYRPGHFALLPNLSWETPPIGSSWPASHARTNGDGLRSDVGPAPPNPPPGEVRVLFLGDSWTFGIGLEEPDTFPLQAQALLARAHPERRWVAINAGVPGYNFFSELDLFEWLVARYRPQVAVFALGESDDILPDLSDQLQEQYRRAMRGLSRFALYRYLRAGGSLLRYRGMVELDIDGAPQPRPELRAQQERRLDAAVGRLRALARTGCRIVFDLRYVRSRAQGDPPPAEHMQWTPFRRFAAVPATFHFTRWDLDAPGMSIPADGHPTPAGARYLAEQVVPAIAAAAGPSGP